MVVIALYVAAITFSGYDFIRLQRQLRTDWQPRLYRFLSEADYERMVKIPTRHAENTFIRSAFIGGFAVLALTLALGYSWLDSIPSKSVEGKGHPKAVADKAKAPDHRISPVAPPTLGQAAVTSTSKIQIETTSKSETSQKQSSNLPEMQKNNEPSTERRSLHCYDFLSNLKAYRELMLFFATYICRPPPIVATRSLSGAVVLLTS